jgi:hypothetical protein
VDNYTTSTRGDTVRFTFEISQVTTPWTMAIAIYRTYRWDVFARGLKKLLCITKPQTLHVTVPTLTRGLKRTQILCFNHAGNVVNSLLPEPFRIF